MGLTFSGMVLNLNGISIVSRPDAPIIGTATATDATTATVSFTAPVYNGGGSITSYTAVSSPDGITGTLSQSGSGIITVSGLSSGTPYTFTVYATNSEGNSDMSAESNSVTPASLEGQVEYTTAGTYTWIVPAGVTSISMVAVGGGCSGRTASSSSPGLSGAGGALAYRNNISVTPGQSITVNVGAGGTSPNTVGQYTFGGDSYVTVSSANVCVAMGGTSALFVDPGISGQVTYRGGYGAGASTGQSSGGGGAGGYAGEGGKGNSGSTNGAAAVANSGGAGGGRGSTGFPGFGGGGVGIYGIGSTGGASSAGGIGGSGGTNGSTGVSTTGGSGGSYGGAGGGGQASGSKSLGGVGGGGAVRIIWPGVSRQFPSLNVS